MDTGLALSPLSAHAARLQTWLFERALPTWWETGADARGGFYERIDQRRRPVDLPQRARTVARQVFSYCEAGKLGWAGPWQQVARHGLQQLTTRFLAPDGTVVATVAGDGRVADAGFDLYNQAFALLALASAHEAFPAESRWREQAVALRDLLSERYAHPAGGYFEDAAGQIAPLRSNPHMHLLESALAWASIDPDPQWRAMADDIVGLALDCFIDPASGALREFFTLDWSPAPGADGRIVEPGHQYEWAFLLNWWAQVSRERPPPAASRLIAFADAHGLDPARGVAVNSVLVDGTMHDAVARLWPQTERVRAYTVTTEHPRAEEAIQALEAYFATSVAGLWYDRLMPDGRFIEEPAPASSLYHIVGAVLALHRAADRRA